MKNCLFEGVRLVKNTDPCKYVHSGYGIGFDSHSELLLPDGSVGKNLIIFGVDMSSSVHFVNKGKYILFLGKGPTQYLNLIDAQYSINFSMSNRKFCLSLHYNRRNSFLFLNATKLYQFKEIKIYALCLGNISGDFSANNIKKQQN